MLLFLVQYCKIMTSMDKWHHIRDRKKSIQYLVRNYVEDPEELRHCLSHDPDTCMICNPAYYGLSPKRALKEIASLCLGYDLADREYTADSIEVVYSTPKKQKLLNSFNKKAFIAAWKKGEVDTLKIVKQIAEQHTADIVVYLDQHIQNSEAPYKGLKQDEDITRGLVADAILRMQYNEAQTIIFGMDVHFDSFKYYPFSPCDALAFFLDVYGLRGLDKGELSALTEFTNINFAGASGSFIPGVKRLDKGYHDFLVDSLMPLLKENYPHIFKRVYDAEMSFMSCLPSVKKGNILTLDIIDNSHISKEDISYFIDHSAEGSFDIVSEDAQRKYFDFETEYIHEMLKSCEDSGVNVKNDEDTEDILDMALHDYYHNHIKPALFKDNFVNPVLYPDDEIFRERMKLEVLPYIPDVLKPDVYWRLWETYITYFTKSEIGGGS